MFAAAITGSGGTVPAGTGKRTEIRAVHGTLPSMAASLVSGTFPGKAAFMGKGAVEPDLLADGRFVLSKGSCDVRLGRMVSDADLDDPALLKGKGFIFVFRHDKNDLLGFCFL